MPEVESAGPPPRPSLTSLAKVNAGGVDLSFVQRSRSHDLFLSICSGQNRGSSGHNHISLDFQFGRQFFFSFFCCSS